MNWQNNSRLQKAADFMWRNARLLERQLFSFLYLGGKREAVLKALGAYQNEDGGFGNALEPDKRSPASQPVDAEVALQVLDVTGFDEKMVRDLCDFLQTITTPEGGIPYALPSIRQYPRTFWWETPDNPPASVNPTAGIAGLLLKNGFSHPWLDKATDFCWKVITTEPISNEVHELKAIITFLENVPERERAEKAFAPIGKHILENKLVELQPEATGYVKKPLDWAPAPTSFCRRLFSDEVIAAHLGTLLARQEEDGGWPISWESVSHVAEMEWRGMVTLEALRTLQAYGRIQ